MCEKSNGQSFIVKPINNYAPENVLYFGVWNELKIESKKDSINWQHLYLYSDSIQSLKHQNGVFEVKPFFILKESDRLKIKIYIIDERKGKLDSIFFEVWPNAFVFEIARANNHPTYRLVDIMKKLRIEGIPYCKDAKNPSLISYDMCLFRDNLCLFKTHMFGNNDFPKSFMDSIKLNIKTDDILIAKNIMIKTSRGEIIVIPSSTTFSPFRRLIDYIH